MDGGQSNGEGQKVRGGRRWGGGEDSREMYMYIQRREEGDGEEITDKIAKE